MFRGNDKFADAQFHADFLCHDFVRHWQRHYPLHNIFDELLCCVVVENDDASVYKLAVAEAVKCRPEFEEKWAMLDGSLVKVPR